MSDRLPAGEVRNMEFAGDAALMASQMKAGRVGTPRDPIEVHWCEAREKCSHCKALGPSAARDWLVSCKIKLVSFVRQSGCGSWAG